MTLKECNTDTIKLCGNEFKKYKHVKGYINEVFERIKSDGFTYYNAWYLVTTYGKQTEEILKTYKLLNKEDIEVRMVIAEARFGITYEMVLTPLDFFIRRTGRLYFDINSVRKFMDPVLAEFKAQFNVDDTQIQIWREELESELERHSNFSLERD